MTFLGNHISSHMTLPSFSLLLLLLLLLFFCFLLLLLLLFFPHLLIFFSSSHLLLIFSPSHFLTTLPPPSGIPLPSGPFRSRDQAILLQSFYLIRKRLWDMIHHTCAREMLFSYCHSISGADASFTFLFHALTVLPKLTVSESWCRSQRSKAYSLVVQS